MGRTIDAMNKAKVVITDIMRITWEDEEHAEHEVWQWKCKNVQMYSSDRCGITCFNPMEPMPDLIIFPDNEVIAQYVTADDMKHLDLHGLSISQARTKLEEVFRNFNFDVDRSFD
jgi:hypothetical protein